MYIFFKSDRRLYCVNFLYKHIYKQTNFFFLGFRINVMKVLPVSLSFRSKYNENNYDSAYMYMPKTTQNKHCEHHFALITAITAVTAVVLTIFSMTGKRKPPTNL